YTGTTGRFSTDADLVHCIDHNLRVDSYYVLRLASHKGKAGITEIVEHRAATAAAPRQADVIFFHPPGITLFPRVLCATNHHGVGIAPEKQNALRGGHLAKNTLFHRQVKPRVVRVRDEQA